MKNALLALLAVTQIALQFGCSSIDKIDASTPEGAFQLAEAYEKDERYDEAVQKYQDVRTKFPYSKLATQAEMKIADVNFKREAYQEAQASYQLFKDFHPKHPQIDYVTYRLALSYYNQLPGSIDRDLSVADKAILYFEEVINSFPKSEYVADSKQKREDALKRLAQKELYIADFYKKHAMNDSALQRYEFLLKTYPNLGYDARALYGAAISAKKVGEKERAHQHYEKLVSLYPGSDEAKNAKDEFR